MNLNEFVIVRWGVDYHSPTLYKKEDEKSIRSDFEEEYPNLSITPAEQFFNDEALAGAIMEHISGELENANRHIDVEVKIFQSLVENGVNHLVAAKAIYDGFEQLF